MADVSEADIGKRVVTANGHAVGTLARISGPGLYIAIDEDIDPAVLRRIKISHKTGLKADERTLGGMPLAAIQSVTDDELRFWPSYAGELSVDAAEEVES